GSLDLLVDNLANSFSSVDWIGVLLGNGDGTFKPVQSYFAGRLPQSFAAGDFNGDGYADVAVVNHIPGTVTVLLNAADGSGGHAGSPLGNHCLPASIHPHVRTEMTFVLLAGSPSQVEGPLPLIFSSLPTNAVPQARLETKTGQIGQTQASFPPPSG